MGKPSKFLTLAALSISGGSIYFLPYLKYVFYDPVLEVMKINNEQMGFLLTLYAMGCILLYIPGGIIADKLSPKKALVASLLATSVLSVIYAFSFDYFLAKIIWVLLAVSSGFVFWSSLIKAIRIIGGSEDQGRTFGLYYAGNGATTAIISAVALWAFSRYADPQIGLRVAILIGAAATTLAALLVLVYFKDDATQGVSSGAEDKFEFSQVGVILKNPLLWFIAFTIFCTYGLYTSGSYFIPYLTNVIGVPVEGSSALGIIRTYVLMFVCAPIGGYFADKLKSTSKWFMICFTVLIALYLVVLVLPKGLNPMVAILLSLLPGAVSLMMYGIMYSTISECRIPLHLTGTVVGIASIIGYLPDFAFNTLFGMWLDQFGNDGYRYIFLFLTSLGVLGLVFSYLIRRATKNLPLSQAQDKLLPESQNHTA